MLFVKFSFNLSQFQCYDTDDGKQYADDGETLHNLWLRNALLLIVVVYRRHEERTFVHRHRLAGR